MADGFTPVFSPAGTGHRAGAVPAPGTNPADYVLRADATWGAANGRSNETGLAGITIPSGQGSATAAIDFANTHASPPQVVATTTDKYSMASVPSGTTHNFVLQVTVATPTIADTGVSVNWYAAE